MTALAGILRARPLAEARALVGAMLQAQAWITNRDPAIRSLGDCVMGRRMYDLLPEDRYDAQPMVIPERGLIVVADVRLDNRPELLRDVAEGAGAEMSDAEIVLGALRKWGLAATAHLVGDFALAIFDHREQCLHLIRDPTGERPLFYCRDRGECAFASLPQALHSFGIMREPDWSELARFVADVPTSPDASFYRNIRQVPPGHVVTLSREGVTTRRHWHLPTSRIRWSRSEDYLEGLREQLDRATRVRMRGAGTLVGTHLSAGLDSAAVTATAARIAPALEVKGFTAAPREDYANSALSGRIADETELAGSVAAGYPNVEQIVVRSGTTSPLDTMDRDWLLFQGPIPHPCNQVWLSAINERAHSEGVKVMLTGEAGNLTLSAGGLGSLAEWVSAGRLLRWLTEARAVAARGARWRGILGSSFAPWIPRPIWRGLVRYFDAGGEGGGFDLLRPGLQAEMRDLMTESRGARPGSDNRQARWAVLSAMNQGTVRKGVLGRWGIDQRDPTADRLLAEYCLSLPTEQLFSEGMTRRLARLALADRLPQRVLHGPRGYQFADWHERINKRLLLGHLDRLKGGGAASQLLDMERLRDLIESWPTTGFNSPSVVARYRLTLLRSLSAAHFADMALNGAGHQIGVAATEVSS